jgi:DNA modification methylase
MPIGITQEDELFPREAYEEFYEEKEFWTSSQRKANRLHEVSYRACFKPQLPAYFIDRFTEPGDVVYDPFAGRGTTAIEAALKGRHVISNDVNPLSEHLTRPRLEIPAVEAIATRLEAIPRNDHASEDFDLGMFFHEKTLVELYSLRKYLLEKRISGQEDHLDRWIRMVAINRLTGHSPGFFSVYSLPPNQAVSRKRQEQINLKRMQTPDYRDTHSLILKKSKSLTSQLSDTEINLLHQAAIRAVFLNSDAADTPTIQNSSVSLVVTSPPFLDIVQYADDNWMRGWFAGINAEEVAARITMSRTLGEWSKKMSTVFLELNRIAKPGGHVAFEVGEIRNGKINLEDSVIPIGLETGFKLEKVMINQQEFSKTSNIWGVKNNAGGTNTNRIVVFQKR